MNEPVIEARALTKTFRHGIVALKDFGFEVERGTVHGLIGRNGSGKTTLLRLLMGLLRADQGSPLVLGHELWTAPRSIRQRVAYVSQTQQLPGRMSLDELGRCLGRFSEHWDQAHARSLADRWALPWNRALGAMSAGDQRKAAILISFASRPEVLILDEPAAGLDLVARRQFIEQVLESISTDGPGTVVLSTHIVADLERIANSITILDRGCLALSVRLDEFLERTKRVQVIFDDENVPEHFAIPGAVKTIGNGPVLNAIVCWPAGNELELLRASTKARVQVFPMALDEVFLELYGNGIPSGPDHETH